LAWLSAALIVAGLVAFSPIGDRLGDPLGFGIGETPSLLLLGTGLAGAAAVARRRLSPRSHQG
jgi:hypothetical protein